MAHVTPEKAYGLTLTQAEAECLVAMLYCHMTYHDESPMRGLYDKLKEALDLRTNWFSRDDLDNLYEKYDKFIGD